jgi:hypothetical protein
MPDVHRAAMTSDRPVRGAPAMLAALLLLAACGEQNRYVAPPPPKITVAHPVQQPITRYLEATGNTAPFNFVDLVARVQGFLQEIHYKDGDTVKRGTVLFTIEPEPYQGGVALRGMARLAPQAARGGCDGAVIPPTSPPQHRRHLRREPRWRRASKDGSGLCACVLPSFEARATSSRSHLRMTAYLLLPGQHFTRAAAHSGSNTPRNPPA